MALAQKQKYRPMEYDRESKNKPTHPWAPCYQQRRQEYTMGQRASALSAAGKTGQLHVKEQN